jgi:hypothetical protein
MKAKQKETTKAKSVPEKKSEWKMEQSGADKKTDSKMMKGKKAC